MATLEMIDPGYPLAFAAVHTVMRPFLSEALEPFCEPVAGIPTLTIVDDDVPRFLAYASAARRRYTIERDLQCISCDEHRDDLLTTWVDRAHFDDFLSNPIGSLMEPAMVDLISRIGGWVRHWSSDVEQVEICGRKLNDRKGMNHNRNRMLSWAQLSPRQQE